MQFSLSILKGRKKSIYFVELLPGSLEYLAALGKQEKVPYKW
jgi:hypothetical protein